MTKMRMSLGNFKKTESSNALYAPGIILIIIMLNSIIRTISTWAEKKYITVAGILNEGTHKTVITIF